MYLLSSLLGDNPYYSFKRPFYERAGYYTFEKDGKLFVLINALGIVPGDIQIEAEVSRGYQVVKVTGKSELFEQEFKTSLSLAFKEPIEQIEKSFMNGLLVLEVTFKEPVKPDIKIINK